MAGTAWNLSIGDIIQRISHAGIFRDGIITEIRRSRLRVDDNIFHDGAKTDRAIDFRLTVFGQVNALGIAAAFNVEDAVIPPAMFIITDKSTMGICGKGRLPRTGKPKEKGHITLAAFITGAVHGKNILLGQEEVHDGENGFFEFPSIKTTANEDNFLVKVQNDEGFRVRSVNSRICHDIGQGNDRKVFRHRTWLIRLDE